MSQSSADRGVVLITGAGGYLGTVLVPVLLEAGWAVRALDRFYFGADLLAPRAGLEVVRADTRLLEPGHLAGVDAVVDLAAISNDPSGERFAAETWAINHAARVRCARLAKAAGARRYVLASSCSVYGFRAGGDEVCGEEAEPRPLTTYAAANARAEEEVLPLDGPGFRVVVLRQATLYGASPRMRFDLAVNGMAYGAWRTGELPLMRDGTQWRPLLHVRDAARAIRFALGAPEGAVGGRVLNVGPAAGGNVRLAELAERVRAALRPREVRVEWYGDPDRRSYRVAFDRLAALGWRTEHGIEEAAAEIVRLLDAGRLARTPRTVTLDWYEALERLSGCVGDPSAAVP